MAKLNITQVRSRIGSTKLQKKNLDALGLRRMNRTVQHDDSKIILGMLEKVKHLVVIEVAQEVKKTKAPKAEKPVKEVKAAAKPAEETKSEAKPAEEKAKPKRAPKAEKPAEEQPQAEEAK